MDGVPSVVGVGVRGYRDIRTRSLLGPLGRMNVLGGVNNSGKSSILAAARVYFPPIGSNGMRDLSTTLPTGLDLPQQEDAEEFQVGFAVDLGPPDRKADTFVSAIVGREVDLSTHHRKAVESVLASPLLTCNGAADVDGSVRWIWGAPDGAPEIFRDTYRDLHEENPQQSREVIQQIANYGASGDMSWPGFLRQVLTRSRGGPQRVVHVPPARRVTATEHRKTELPGSDGAGLPGMLLSLIAPRAEEFRTARRRLALINDFLREALGNPRVELLVPHDADTVHVAIDRRVLPLSHLGAGIEQLVLLATICTEYDKTLILMEEPDLYMHPTLQRRFIRQLRDKTSNSYVMTTHSAVLLDTDIANVFKVDWSAGQGTTVALVSTPNDRAALATLLGFRASDLVQANAVIWVEGPSDRIYLKKWLSLVDDELVEGVHYSFVMYGGRLAEHLTASEAEQGTVAEERLDRFLQITRINRHAIFVMDSDLTETDQPLASYKVRIQEEFAEDNSGLTWVTAGVMIENYVEPSGFRAAYAKIHSRKNDLPYTGDLSCNPFVGGVKQPDKVGIAEAVVATQASVPDRADLLTKLQECSRYLRQVNGMG